MNFYSYIIYFLDYYFFKFILTFIDSLIVYIYFFEKYFFDIYYSLLRSREATNLGFINKNFSLDIISKLVG